MNLPFALHRALVTIPVLTGGLLPTRCPCKPGLVAPIPANGDDKLGSAGEACGCHGHEQALARSWAGTGQRPSARSAEGLGREDRTKAATDITAATAAAEGGKKEGCGRGEGGQGAGKREGAGCVWVSDELTGRVIGTRTGWWTPAMWLGSQADDP